MKQIKTSAQKKFLFIPAFNFFIIWIFVYINSSYLKSKGKSFGLFNFKLVFGAFINALWIQVVYAIWVLFLIYLNLLGVFEVVIGFISLYLSITLASWRLIKFQNKLGIEE